MKSLIKTLCLVIYYLIGVKFPTQPMPGYKIGYLLRRVLVKRIAEFSGNNVIIKQNCYIGSGIGLRIGDSAQLGHNSRIDQYVTIGNDVVMGPDVIIMTNHHAFDRTDIPINQQGALKIRPVIIGNDVWIGTRAIILPGVEIGDHSIVGAGAVVTKSFPAFSILAGNPARILKIRASI